jgi:carboxymethylenebutenolidase
MNDRITIKAQAGAFGAYMVRPKTLPATAVVVLQALFGVNTDIRKHCGNLAEQGFIAAAPDLFWRQEPGVDPGVTTEADWQHGRFGQRLCLQARCRWETKHGNEKV